MLRGCGEKGNPTAPLVGNETGVSFHHGKQYEVPKTNKATMMQQFHFWVYIWEEENSNVKRYMHVNVHSSNYS